MVLTIQFQFVQLNCKYKFLNNNFINNFNFNLRFAISLGATSCYVSVSEKIRNGVLFIQHIDKAIEINPSDYLLHHLLGRFSFEVIHEIVLIFLLEISFWFLFPNNVNIGLNFIVDWTKGKNGSMVHLYNSDHSNRLIKLGSGSAFQGYSEWIRRRSTFIFYEIGAVACKAMENQ